MRAASVKDDEEEREMNKKSSMMMTMTALAFRLSSSLPFAPDLFSFLDHLSHEGQ